MPVTADRDAVLAVDRSERLKTLDLPVWYFPMLNDRERNEAYRIALAGHLAGEKAANASVLDLGTGTALLALYAREAGAKNVSACEVVPELVRMATKVVDLNGARDEIRLIPKLSTRLEVSSDLGGVPVDLLVTETFDAGLFGEHVLESLDHAWKNLLRENAVVVPGGATVFVALVRCPDVARKFGLKKRGLGLLSTRGLRFGSASTAREPYSCESLSGLEHDMLSQEVELLRVNFSDRTEVERLLRQSSMLVSTLPVTAGGNADALALWFELHLGHGQSVNTRPAKSRRCGWQQAIFPLKTPLTVEAGETAEATFEMCEHLRLVSCRSKRGHQREAEEGETVLVAENVLLRCNDDAVMTVYESFARRFCSSRRDYTSILDAAAATGAASCLISLQLLKLKPESSSVSFYFDQISDDAMKRFVDFAAALAKVNGLDTGNISGIFPSSLANSEFDVLVLDPVLASGQLNVDLASQLPLLAGCLKDDATVVPDALSVHCLLVESEDLYYHARMRDDLENFRIHDVVNEFAPKHLMELDMSKIPHRRLALPEELGELQTLLLGGNHCFETEVQVKADGIAHGVVYFFRIDYDDEDEESGSVYTWRQKSVSCYRQSAFLLEKPVAVTKGQIVCYRVKICEAVISIGVTFK